MSILALVLASHGKHSVKMLHGLSAQPRDAFLHVRRHGAGSAVRVDQHGDEGLRHPRAGSAPTDPQGFDALAPDGVRKRGLNVDYPHKRAKLAPMLRRMSEMLLELLGEQKG